MRSWNGEPKEKWTRVITDHHHHRNHHERAGDEEGRGDRGQVEQGDEEEAGRGSEHVTIIIINVVVFVIVINILAFT